MLIASRSRIAVHFLPVCEEGSHGVSRDLFDRQLCCVAGIELGEELLQQSDGIAVALLGVATQASITDDIL